MPKATVHVPDWEVQEQHARSAYADEDTPLSKATAGKFKEMYLLLKEGQGNANDHGRSYFLLHHAVFWESHFGVAILINEGAHVNVQTLEDDDKLQIARGSTPLHIAALLGKEGLVRLLLCSGANPNARDANGKTPAELDISPQCRDLITSRQVTQQALEMYEAAFDYRFIDALELQILNKLPFDIKKDPRPLPDGSDYYVIHQVAHAGDLNSYRLMLALGACPLLRTMGKKGKPRMLPSEVARSCGHENLVNFMQEAERKALERL